VRSRNIKPGFFKNERLAEIPPDARLLFIGLWLMADREGRLEDRPKRIKAEIFPYENRNIDTLLNKLWKAGFITRYKVDGHAYILVLKFKCHQNPHINEKASIIPAPSDIGTFPEDSGTNPADSLLLIPSSLNPDIPHSRQKPECGFESFWILYPKKVAKGQAETTWAKVTKTTNPREIVAGLERQLPSLKSKDRQYIQNPSTWLNAKGWLDEVEAGGKVSAPARIFSGAEEAEIAAALEVYRSGDFAGAQMMVSDELWMEVMRRGKR
jgi:hypothetical protein